MFPFVLLGVHLFKGHQLFFILHKDGKKDQNSDVLRCLSFCRFHIACHLKVVELRFVKDEAKDLSFR